MEGSDVPPFFICPISLQIMKDPVTVSTGMTFDRESIQKWLFSYNKCYCPITKQPLSNYLLTPNSNLLRLIESWHTHNASSTELQGMKMKQPMSDASNHLNELVEELKQPHLQIKSLQKVKTLLLIQQDGDHRTDIAGVASVVASLITKIDPQDISHISTDRSIIIEGAISVLYLLNPSTDLLKKIGQDKDGLLIESLCSITIQHVSYQARIQAALLLKKIFQVVDNIYKAKLNPDLFEGIAEILKDQNSVRASKAVLSILMEVLAFGKNRIKVIKAGVVSVLIELLAESKERRLCEMMLGVLDQLCKKAEGRAAFLAHPVGIAAVSYKILRISHVANDRAMMVLLSVFRACNSCAIAQEVMEVGGVTKICMVVQAEGSLETKEKAREILGLHLKTWNKSSCFPSSFKA